MKTETTTSTENKPELLWEDKQAIVLSEKEAVKTLIAINQFLREAKSILGPLTDEQKMILIQRRVEFVREEITKQFQFPNAAFDFNMQALGKDLTQIEKLDIELRKNHPISAYEFEINDDGEFILKDDQPIYEKHRYYLDSDKKKVAMELANALIECIEIARDMGIFLEQHSFPMLLAFHKIIKPEDMSDRESKFIVNKEEIAARLDSRLH